MAYSFLLTAFYFVYRRPRCGGRRSIILVWITAAVVVLTTAFPWYARDF